MSVTPYFQNDVIIRRPYVTEARCRAVMANPLRQEVQPDGRVRYWGKVTLPNELGDRILRVVALADGTLHNGFVDRGYREKQG